MSLKFYIIWTHYHLWHILNHIWINPQHNNLILDKLKHIGLITNPWTSHLNYQTSYRNSSCHLFQCIYPRRAPCSQQVVWYSSYAWPTNFGRTTTFLSRFIEKIKLLMVLKITISLRVFLITFEKLYIKFNSNFFHQQDISNKLHLFLFFGNQPFHSF